MKILNKVVLTVIFISLFSCEPQEIPVGKNKYEIIQDSINQPNIYVPILGTGDQDDEVEGRGDE